MEDWLTDGISGTRKELIDSGGRDDDDQLGPHRRRDGGDLQSGPLGHGGWVADCYSLSGWPNRIPPGIGFRFATADDPANILLGHKSLYVIFFLSDLFYSTCMVTNKDWGRIREDNSTDVKVQWWASSLKGQLVLYNIMNVLLNSIIFIHCKELKGSDVCLQETSCNSNLHLVQMSKVSEKSWIFTCLNLCHTNSVQ